MKDVVVATFIDHDEKRRLKAAKQIGLKIRGCDDVIATINGPQFEEDSNPWPNEILIASSLELTGADVSELIANVNTEDTAGKVAFSIDDPEFDMEKFSGRFNSFLKVSNPRHAFYSNKKIREFQKLLDDQREKEEQ